jgi:hypothetical protein
MKGVTTYDQVIAMYGRPKREIRNSEGKTMVSYHQAIARRSPDSFWIGRFARHQGNIESRRLDVVFNPNKVVEHYKFFESAQPVESHFSHFETGTPVLPEKLVQIKKKQTTKTELITLFGSPVMDSINFDGESVLAWLFGKIGALRTSDFQILEVVFDEAGTVKDFQVQNVRR